MIILPLRFQCHFTIFLRSYVKDTIDGSEILSGDVKNAYFHYALFQDIAGWGGYKNDYWAPCLTYVPQHRVPPREEYNVKDKEHTSIYYLTIKDNFLF